MGFLDNLSSSVNRGVASAGRTTETFRLKNQLNDINKQRQALSAQLGASLYEMTRDNPELRAGREGLYDGIAALDAQRDAINAQIAQIEEQQRLQQAQAQVFICPKCGGRVGATDMFCMTCGLPIDQVRAAASAPVMQPGQAACPKCGAPMNAGGTFCMSCGTNVKEFQAAQATSAPAAPAAPVSAPAEQQASADGGTVCPSCGTPYTPGADAFCANCGAKLS